MSRMSIVVFSFLCLFFEDRRCVSQSVVEKPSTTTTAKEGRIKDGEELRAFNAPDRAEVLKASRFISAIGVIVFIGFVSALFLIYRWYEPSFLTKSYDPSTVERSENFEPYRKPSSGLYD